MSGIFCVLVTGYALNVGGTFAFQHLPYGFRHGGRLPAASDGIMAGDCRNAVLP
jgi:hypothetical protein